jgi:hypothetical protein
VIFKISLKQYGGLLLRCKILNLILRTTVGYGDYVPSSFPGKIIGSLSLVFGVLVFF